MVNKLVRTDRVIRFKYLNMTFRDFLLYKDIMSLICTEDFSATLSAAGIYYC